MLRDNLRDNHVALIGKLAEAPVFVCEHMGVKYYDGLMHVPTPSGNVNRVPITADEHLSKSLQVLAKEHKDASFVIEGHIVSRGNNLRAQTSIEYPMAVSIEDIAINLASEKIPASRQVFQNDVEIKGYICENPINRTTPFGREICELTIAVPKDAGRDGPQNYIKCIAWNGTARFGSRLYIGAFVEGLGRFQSRAYTKVLDNGKSVQCYAYEVSLYVMADGRI